MTLSRSELRTWYRFIAGIRALTNALDRQLRDEAGMSHAEYTILVRLYRESGRTMRMSELAREAGFSPSRLSHAVRRFEREGLMTRRGGLSDGRAVEATLTDLGTARVREITRDHLKVVKTLFLDTLGFPTAGETADAMDLIRKAAEQATGTNAMRRRR